jgi:hypothetical protein
MTFFIITKADAVKVIKLYTNMLLVYTVFQLTIGILFRPDLLIDVAINFTWSKV